MNIIGSGGGGQEASFLCLQRIWSDPSSVSMCMCVWSSACMCDRESKNVHDKNVSNLFQSLLMNAEAAKRIWKKKRGKLSQVGGGGEEGNAADQVVTCLGIKIKGR